MKRVIKRPPMELTARRANSSANKRYRFENVKQNLIREANDMFPKAVDEAILAATLQGKTSVEIDRFLIKEENLIRQVERLKVLGYTIEQDSNTLTVCWNQLSNERFKGDCWEKLDAQGRD